MTDRDVKYHRKDVPIPDDLVSIDQVLHDMSDPDSGMGAEGARSYYYLHYATDEERKRMDAEDSRTRKIAITIAGVVSGVLLYLVVAHVLKLF